MRKQFALTISCVISLFLSFSTQAQETSSTLTYEGSWYIGGGYIGLDSATTDPQGVGSGGFTLDMGYTGTYSNGFIFNLGMYIPFFSDDDSYSQRTKDQYGKISTKESSINGWGLIAEAGYKFHTEGPVSFGLSGGFRSLSADREIDNCVDCYSEDIDLDGGVYLRPALFFDNPSVDLEVAALLFATGDMTNGIMFNIHW